MSAIQSTTPEPIVTPASNGVRVAQLVFGIATIVGVANLQYGWTLFVAPMDAKFHWGRPAIQVAFTILILAESWLLPFCGSLVDKRGARAATIAAGLLAGGSWVLNSFADSLWLLYLSAALGGLGIGLALSVAVGNALKWFPDHRGLAAGLTSGAFGVGSAITIIPIQSNIAAYGYQNTFLWFGLVQGIALLLLSFVIRSPRPGEVRQPPSVHIAQSVRDVEPTRVVREPLFWVMYAIFVLVCTGGLMATAQLAPIASDLHLADSPVTLMFITLPALSFALSLDRVLNGVTRPFFGWVSDRLGRENTMFVAFLLEGIGIYALSQFGHDPIMFVLLTGLVFFAWGEIYSLFPALCTDTFGARNAAANYGLIFTAKGAAALLVPLGSILVGITGSWHAVFVTSCVMDVAAAFLALLVLKPMRIRYASGQQGPSTPTLTPAPTAV